LFVLRVGLIQALGLRGRLMNYDKVKPDGTRIEAPRFTYRVLESVPVVFQLFEWLLVIVAFQYADVRFGFVAAKIVWIGLTLAFALYFGVLMSNVQWRIFEDPYKNRWWRVLSLYVSPVLSGVVFYGLQQLVKQMVATQG
jgi:hypothetical protein